MILLLHVAKTYNEIDRVCIYVDSESYRDIAIYRERYYYVIASAFVYLCAFCFRCQHSCVNATAEDFTHGVLILQRQTVGWRHALD